MPKLLTIIVTYNAMRWVDQCLGSVKASTVKSDLFIVDNGSSDGTRTYIAEHYPDAILVRSEVNLMFGRANNLGLEFALKNGYDYVYLLNQDAWVMPETFEMMIEIQKKHVDFGLLSPIQNSSDGYSYEKLFGHLVVEKLENDYRERALCEVEFVQAAHWLLTRRSIEIVGGFSPSFPHYGEDENFCHRARHYGLKIGVVPHATAVHDAANNPLATNKQKRYRYYIHFVIALSNVNDSRPLPNLLQFLLRRAKSLAMERKTLTPFEGYFKALAHLYQIRRNRYLSMTQKCSFLNV